MILFDRLLSFFYFFLFLKAKFKTVEIREISTADYT